MWKDLPQDSFIGTENAGLDEFLEVALGHCLAYGWVRTNLLLSIDFEGEEVDRVLLRLLCKVLEAVHAHRVARLLERELQREVRLEVAARADDEDGDLGLRHRYASGGRAAKQKFAELGSCE